MTGLAENDIRLKNRAGLVGAQIDDGAIGNVLGEQMVNPFVSGAIGNVATPPTKVATIAKTMDIDTSYARYKQGKGFGRSDLFAVIIDEIKDLKRRIGSVDEAKVSDLDGRLSALERTIGNALSASVPEKRGPGRPKAKPEGDE